MNAFDDLCGLDPELFGWGYVTACCEIGGVRWFYAGCGVIGCDRSWRPADRGRIQNADRLLAFWFLWPISYATCDRSHLAPEIDLDGNFADLIWGAIHLSISFLLCWVGDRALSCALSVRTRFFRIGNYADVD
ncbi:hypothetical protein Nepgr_027179 [Nepenthes gracilis]|uniref:Uncharacterized protein n=1 Tax=Nepenthes gracilis TaxID=150966 RepID=A0AAD3Y3A5_NEPGR|nr:hypothetical protein Nepgr_027179 [Nepenthes gracilis]